jgi:S-adenosylmethionine hydrolase
MYLSSADLRPGVFVGVINPGVGNELSSVYEALNL